MYLKVLRATRMDLCQADEDEILVPNPVILPGYDNDFFVGLESRRPCRYGRVAAIESFDARYILETDLAGFGGVRNPEDNDEERQEDIDYLLEFIADMDLGAAVGCRYYQDAGDEDLTWELFETDEE